MSFKRKTNIVSDTQTINFNHERTTSGIAVTAKDALGFPVPANDATNLWQTCFRDW